MVNSYRRASIFRIKHSNKNGCGLTLNMKEILIFQTPRNYLLAASVKTKPLWGPQNSQNMGLYYYYYYYFSSTAATNTHYLHRYVTLKADGIFLEEGITKWLNECIINYIRQHRLFKFIHKATCFDPSVGHLQAYTADYVIGAVCILGSQYVHINKLHIFGKSLARDLPNYQMYVFY